MAQEHYSKAPIQEALIDLHVASSPDVTLSHLDKLGDLIAGDYPQKDEYFLNQFRFELGKQPSAEVGPTQTGYKFVSSDKHYVLQAHLNSFTLSVLPQYDRWEPFRDETRRLWNLYRGVTNPTEITSISVRYINRIDIKADKIELRDYVRTFPEISSDLPQELNNYTMQVTLSVQELTCKLIIVETIIPPPSSEYISLVLDNNLIRDQNVPQDEEALWSFIEQMRVYKNKVFTASITERTKELISN